MAFVRQDHALMAAFCAVVKVSRQLLIVRVELCRLDTPFEPERIGLE